MLTEKKQKEIVYKTCLDVMNNKINTLNTLYNLWNKELFDTKFFYDIFNTLTEYFVGVDIGKGKINENSDEFLDVYAALKTLEYDKKIDDLYTAYKNTIKIKNLTKKKVDENLKKILEK